MLLYSGDNDTGTAPFIDASLIWHTDSDLNCDSIAIWFHRRNIVGRDQRLHGHTYSLWPLRVNESINPTFQNDNESRQCKQADKVEGTPHALKPPIVSVVLTVRPDGSSEIGGRSD